MTAIRTIWAAGPMAVTPAGAVVVIPVGGLCGAYFGAQGGDRLSTFICEKSRHSGFVGDAARWTVRHVTHGVYTVC